MDPKDHTHWAMYVGSALKFSARIGYRQPILVLIPIGQTLQMGKWANGQMGDQILLATVLWAIHIKQVL